MGEHSSGPTEADDDNKARVSPTNLENYGKVGSGFSSDGMGLEVPALFPSLAMLWPACDTRFALLSWEPDVLQRKAYEQMIKI